MKIGFIGVGIMGKSMVRNLMKAGFDVCIYTRTKSKVLDVIEEGAVWTDTIRECAADKDAVITMIGYPKDVEEVYFGQDGIMECAKQGAYLIDMTTNSPELAIQIYDRAKENGFFALDAPVTGGDIGAKEGTLTIMVGGEEGAYHTCKRIFEAMGDHIVYEGKAGNGQHTKMANQIAIAGTISAVCEAMTYAKAAGLDVETMINTIKKGSAASTQLSSAAPKILKGDYAPGFFIKHFIKDMRIAASEAKARGLELPVLEEVLKMYGSLEERGAGDLGTQALIKYYEE
ncbi:3-hydroxyisobutyrate dehydrogenase/2-hydroxy-3-oxopropionate reductase [Anaerotaenia torta]|uniref:NAD(P)-dependent oxidoreductase n=1 Tax=Anaerotaenia torta TaxID=433293 RepID=UPI003D25589B